MKGFKALKVTKYGTFYSKPFLSDRRHYFKIGKSYEVTGAISLCWHGFHFCETPRQVLNYYKISPDTFFFKISASKAILESEGNLYKKYVAKQIKIEKVVPMTKIMELLKAKKVSDFKSVPWPPAFNVETEVFNTPDLALGVNRVTGDNMRVTGSVYSFIKYKDNSKTKFRIAVITKISKV